MEITVIDCGSSKVPDIVKMLEREGVMVKVCLLKEASEFPLGDGVVISGAPILLTEINYDAYLKQSEFIKTASVPVLGICFGHQLMGLHYGAKVKRCNEDRDWQKLKFFGETPINEGFAEDMLFKEDHCECISLPSSFNLVASSATCEVEMMIHKTKHLIGVQFHPEVSDENGQNLMNQFIALCKK